MEQNTERIERYLDNLMDAGEQAAFEQEMERNPGLKAETDMQRQLLKGIEVAAARAEFESAVRQRGLSLLAAKAGLVLLAALLIAAAVFLLKPKEQSIPNKATADTAVKPLPIRDSSSMPGIAEQVFELNIQRDTIITTRGGLVLAIEAGTFHTESGKADIRIREALRPADILQAGLSTQSNGKLLETGGMFSIYGFENGRCLDMRKPVLTRIPTDSFDKGMMLYEGVKDSNGLVNWVNPKPIQKPLQTTDITTLDFYPPDYLKTLERLGLPHQDKRYTDSLYYALSGYQPPVTKKVSDRKNIYYRNWWRNLMEHNDGRIEVRYREKGQTKGIMFKDWKAYNRFEDSIQKTLIVKRDLPKDNTPVVKYNTEIDPARIRAIWSPKFNNTILASKAFEERLKFIFSTCQPRFLDLYVQNLDKNLYEIDSLCAAVSGGSFKEKFLEFYKRRDGGVPLEKGIRRKLNRYFETQSTAYRKAAENTRAELQKQLADEQEAAGKAALRDALDKLEKGAYTESEQFCRNLKRAYEALGETVECPKQTPPPAKAYYEVRILRPGTYNVDKPAIIILEKNTAPSYSTLELTVNRYESFDRVMVYLLPGGLSSFQRINLQVNGTFREQMNDFLFYDAVVLAFKGDALYFAKEKNIRSGRQMMEPKPVTEAEFEAQVQMYGFGGSDNAYTHALKGLGKGGTSAVLQHLKAEQEQEQILKSVFPCFDKGVQNTAKPASKETVILAK